jgi:choice-of-anchor A domain-containing protein
MPMNLFLSLANQRVLIDTLKGLILLVALGCYIGVRAQKITDPALNFALFIKEDVTLVGTEIEGRVAAGGNLTLGQNTYQIVPKTNDGFNVGGISIGLAIRGGLVLPGNSLLQVNQKNYVQIGNATSPNALKVNYQAGDFSIRYASGSGGRIKINTNPSEFGSPAASETHNPVIQNVFGSGPGKIDIDRAFEIFEAASTTLGSLGNTVTIKNFDNAGAPPVSPPYDNVSKFQNVKPKVILASDRRNVLNITADVWSSFSNGVFFEGFSTHKNFELIINILNANGKTVYFPNSPELQNNKGRVIFNFPNTNQSVMIKPRAQLNGVIMAPKANVIKQQGANLEGQVIARAFTHDGDEIHYYPYLPQTECNGQTFLSGRVLDQTSPIAHVPLLLMPLFDGADTLRSFTNYNGEYRFTGVPEGDYQIQVQDQNLILVKQLFPVDGNSEIIRMEICKPKELNFGYQKSLRPSVGDLVWLDINKDNQQNEWFDANGDDEITRNRIDIEGFEALRLKDWEWVDVNSNGRWDLPEDEGELNKAAVSGTPHYANIVLSGPSGYQRRVVIGPDGYWRENPHLTTRSGSEVGLFGDFTARLDIDESLTRTALRLASTGKVKVFDRNGKAVRDSHGGGAGTIKRVVSAPFGTIISGGVSEVAPVNKTLDLGLVIETEDIPMPVTLASFEARWNAGENQVELRWGTSREANSEGFEVLFSTNGANWNSVGFVRSENADQGATYQFQHLPRASGIAYYRLKMLDKDATYEYSQTVSIMVKAATQVRVYPNPSTDFIRIEATEGLLGLKEARFTDALGNLLRRVDAQTSQIDVSALSPGIYYLRLIYQDGSFETVKVLKK